MRLLSRSLALRSLLAASLAELGWQGREAAAVPLQLADTLNEGRVPGIGGGSDLLADRLKATDVLYPPAVLGEWRVSRMVSSVEGDVGQAETAWRALGGAGDFRKPEAHLTRFVRSPRGQVGVVTDRGFEYAQRSGSAVEWVVSQPDELQAGPVTLSVVQREIEPFQPEPPYGFGTTELYRISSPAGGLLGSGLNVQRAVKVARRYRPGDDGIDILEIVKTYRVMDDIAGTEMPTSTTKSRLKLQRVNAAAEETR
eukprot:scaffold275642_cov33-Tisochrysis_lutea.AAC.1